ncbi:MAG: biopolymer transporter ExbD [Chthoniobacteraceae bacterium]
MKLRRRAEPLVMGFQIAPMVDVLLVLLCFFILTWNFARKEMELDVKVPTAENGGEPTLDVNQTVLNLKADGSMVMNTRPITFDELGEKMATLAKINKDYAIILRGDENVAYKYVARVLDVCRGAGIWNIAFPVSRPKP